MAEEKGQEVKGEQSVEAEVKEAPKVQEEPEKVEEAPKAEEKVPKEEEPKAEEKPEEPSKAEEKAPEEKPSKKPSKSAVNISDATPAQVVKVFKKVGLYGECYQVMVRVLEGKDRGNLLRRNVRGPIKEDDLLMLKETERDVRAV